MKSSFFIFAATGAVTAAALVFACGNSSSENATGSDAGGDATISTQDGQSSSDGAAARDGTASDGGVADASTDASGGDAAVVCTGPAGVLDTTFGDGGMVWLEYNAAQVGSVAVQSDGKIVIGGATQAGLALVRLMPNGSLDPTFGTNGLVTTLFGQDPDLFRALAIQPDGKIIAVGDTNVNGDFHAADFAVLRYLSDGTLDPSFGDGGAVSTDFASTKTNQVDDIPASVALLPDGRILVAGSGDPNDVVSATNYELARYNPNGSLDTTFGNGGLLIIDVHGTSDSPGVAALIDGGKMIVAGASAQNVSSSSPNDLSVVQLTPSGSVDPSYADGGVSVQNIDSASLYPTIRGLLIDENEKAVVVGEFPGSGNTDFGIIRLSQVGEIDPMFGDAGLNTTDNGGRDDSPNAVALQSDGRILAGGSSFGGTRGNLIVRYQPNGAVDTTFGASGLAFTATSPTVDMGISGMAVAGCYVLAVGGVDNLASSTSYIGIYRYSR